MASSAITDMQNWTTMEQAAAQQINGPNNELNQDMFLKLMLEQLKYQDPLNPMDNQEFLAQQAQFTQLNEMQKMNTQMASNDTVQQCISLIGKEVELINPDDPESTIKGVVTEATFDSNGSSIKVNGKNYPLGLVTSVRTPGASETPAADSGSETKTDQTAEQTLQDEAKALFGANISKIAQFAGLLIDKYLK